MRNNCTNRAIGTNMVNMKGAAMRQKTITADKKYLLIPVGNVKGWTIPTESIQYLSIYQNGSLVEEYEVCLNASPRCWSCLYLERYVGETLELRLEGGDESLIELLEVSDTLKDADTLYREPMRPLAHITPMHGFMNDPNGLFYLNGKYHCFAQLNPYGLGVGNTHWMHMVSSDLMHWQELPYALLPDETGRMYSGCGVVDLQNTSGLGKDGIPPVFLFYTPAGSKSRWSRGKYFEIAAAVSTDGGMHFEKYAQNPIVQHIAYMNRDPKVVWDDQNQNWVMVIFLDNDRYMFLYSDNLLHWEQGETIRIRGSAECPDLFNLPIDNDMTQRKWVLWGSTDNYIIGHFEGRHFVPETDVIEGPTHRIDSAYSLEARSTGGYAAQTFANLPNGRVIQISWIQTVVSQGPFSSCLSIPNELRLVSTEQGPRITIKPAAEVKDLRECSYSFVGRGLEEFERIPREYLGEAMDMTFKFSIKPDKLIAFSVRGVLIVYDPKIERLLLPVGAYKLALKDDTFELRVVTDRCSVELYADDGKFNLTLATIPDPTNISILPVLLDPGIGIDFEVHKLKSMWE